MVQLGSAGDREREGFRRAGGGQGFVLRRPFFDEGAEVRPARLSAFLGGRGSSLQEKDD